MTEKEREDAERVFAEGVQKLLSETHSKDFVLWILQQCGTFATNYGGDRTEWKEGRRSIGLEILALMTQCAPEAYPAMMKEALEREEIERMAREQREADDT